MSAGPGAAPGSASAATGWHPEQGGLMDLVQCLKDAETGDSATQRVVLEVCGTVFDADTATWS